MHPENLKRLGGGHSDSFANRYKLQEHVKFPPTKKCQSVPYSYAVISYTILWYIIL